MRIYTIPGNPIALKRARYCHRTRKIYNSQRNELLVLSLNIESQHDNAPLYEGPLHLDVTFFMPIKTSNAKKQKSMINTYHMFKPDVDNLVKLVADISTGILYKDDALIASISARKVYALEPRTEFTIKGCDKHGENNDK